MPAVLGWFKNKIGGEQHSFPEAEAELRTQLAKVEKFPNAKYGLLDRLINFALTGEGESVLSELSTIRPQTSRYGSIDHEIFASPLADHLARLGKLLPEDPELYLRLSRVYEAVKQANTGIVRYSSLISIPGFAGTLDWFTNFLIELSEVGTRRNCFPASLARKMIVAKGHDPSLLVKGAFFYEDSTGQTKMNKWLKGPFVYFECLTGFAELVHSAPDIIRPAFQQKDAGCRTAVLHALVALNVSLEPFADEIATLAVSGSKGVREVADRMISERFPIFQSSLEKLAEKGTSDERYYAVRLLAQRGDEAAHTFLVQRLQSEKSARVIEALGGACNLASEMAVSPKKDFELPKVAAVPVHAPLDKQVFEDLCRCLEDYEEKLTRELAGNNPVALYKGRIPLDARTAHQLISLLESFVVKEGEYWSYINHPLRGVAHLTLENFAAHPKFKLIHLVRWCLLITGRSDQEKRSDWLEFSINYRWRGSLSAYQKARKQPIDLRELAAVFETVGLPNRTIGKQLLNSNRYAISPLQRGSVIWPYFSERLELLEEALGLRQLANEGQDRFFWESERRKNAFEILKLFPHPPARFVPLLWDIALGRGKTERPQAQECLESFPNKEEKIIAALASRQQDARSAAAEWLAELRHKEAIPALKAAFAKEKSEPVKDQLIKALEVLGISLEELLDRDKLDQEAEQGLKKGIPKVLEWFPFAQLPAVRWSDSGNEVPATVLQWFLVQSCRLGNAEAGPILRRYCSLIRKDDREALGKFILESWIAMDTKPLYTAEQAAAEAQKFARHAAISAQNYPKYYPDFNEERFYQATFNRLLTQPEGSQTSTKGILAVAGACCGGDAAPIVHRYVKQWYGYRGAQSKALLQVLAWIEHPNAIQVVLSVANRFRTKGIQEEAMRLCNMLAERKGWTFNQLSDRTIPTAGLDEDGMMELDYGARKFIAKLNEEMTISLTNPDGKTVASLPDPNQSDDAEKARQAKANLSAARKELKSSLAMQKERLYEAMCTQRTWRFDEWETYLRKHPIVGRYCQRLVWLASENDKVVGSFRPLPDGSLTNHEDAEVTISQEASITLAHDETLPDSDRQAWLQHFADYKVDPLFQQFGKAKFDLPETLKSGNEVTEFQGYIVKAFSLRNRLTKLGYTRGAAQDGGWFYDYHKNFPGLGVEAVIEFTGNGLPEENRTVALQRLHFSRKHIQAGPTYSEGLTLGELPRVLLSECWNDLRMAAAEGPGFSPDWEKQTEP